MTTTTTTSDLSWVTFTSDEHAPRCDFRLGKCPAQATHAGIYKIVYGCTHDRILYCLAHRDLILNRAQHNGSRFVCRSICGPDSLTILLRMEALR